MSVWADLCNEESLYYFEIKDDYETQEQAFWYVMDTLEFYKMIHWEVMLITETKTSYQRLDYETFRIPVLYPREVDFTQGNPKDLIICDRLQKSPEASLQYFINLSKMLSMNGKVLWIE